MCAAHFFLDSYYCADGLLACVWSIMDRLDQHLPTAFLLSTSCVSCFFFGYFLTAYWHGYIADASRLFSRLRYDMAGGWRLGMCLSVGLRGI
jgi:hypothetical protein